MGGQRAEDLLRRPVRLNGLDVGHPVDLILDPHGGRALGLNVLCRDEVQRFLPLAAAELRVDEIRLASPFALVDQASSEFYKGRATTFLALRGTRVARGARELGLLRDVIVTPSGEIEALVVERDDGVEEVPLSRRVVLGGNGN